MAVMSFEAGARFDMEAGKIGKWHQLGCDLLNRRRAPSHSGATVFAWCAHCRMQTPKANPPAMSMNSTPETTSLLRTACAPMKRERVGTGLHIRQYVWDGWESVALLLGTSGAMLESWTRGAGLAGRCDGDGDGGMGGPRRARRTNVRRWSSGRGGSGCAGWVGLTRVEVPGFGWSLDNLVVPHPSGIPEPATPVLWLLGAAALWGFRPSRPARPGHRKPVRQQRFRSFRTPKSKRPFGGGAAVWRRASLPAVEPTSRPSGKNLRIPAAKDSAWGAVVRACVSGRQGCRSPRQAGGLTPPASAFGLNSREGSPSPSGCRPGRERRFLNRLCGWDDAWTLRVAPKTETPSRLQIGARAPESALEQQGENSPNQKFAL